jgi:hypothetical protein
MIEIRGKRTFFESGLVLVLIGVAFVAPTVLAQDDSDEVVEVDGRQWSLVTGSGAVPWDEADEFCDTLEAGGLSDWRLPTLFELETLHDPAAASSIRGPFELADCCAWSATNLLMLAPERKGGLPDPAGPPAGYYWGFLFEGGTSYYSNGRFPDGFALCTRGPQQD